MATAHDVAASILKRTGPIDTFKLEKLAYYAKAWHFVWQGVPLFSARIEAWAHGPVVPALYEKHRGQFAVQTWRWGDEGNLSEDEIETIETVLLAYKKYRGWELAELTHREDPWRLARESEGLTEGQRGNPEITDESMQTYYEQRLLTIN